MIVNDKTKICVSIAGSRGRFGVNFHNPGYADLGLDFVYVPLELTHCDLSGFARLLRSNFLGCSVSMPYKSEIIRYLDKLDESALMIEAVNTILNDNGDLIGFNTDYYGAKSALEKSLDLKGKKALLLGAGGAAKAVAHALSASGSNVTISNRDEEKAQRLASRVGAGTILWELRNDFEGGDILVNATSVGFDDPEEMPVISQTLRKYEAVMDVVTGKETTLIREAREAGKLTIAGNVMAVYQAAKQFEIYTGKKLTQEFIAKKFKETGGA